MKSLFIYLVATLFICNSFAQPRNARATLLPLIPPGGRVVFLAETPSSNASNANISNFLRFYIPSAITTEGIEPAAISSFNIGFGDDKMKLKWGFSRNKDESRFLRNSWGISASAKAPEGVKTLFQFDKSPTDVQLGIGYTYIINERAYSVGGVQSAEEAYWLNINFNYTRNKVILFSNDTAYNKIKNNNFSLLFSINHYFNSWYRKKDIHLRNIWNIGVGVGHFTNYDDLDDITIHKGNIAGSYFSETESVIGKKGDLSRVFGAILRGSLFYPISHPESKAYLMLGVNANSFGLGTDKFTANANGGIYISKRKYDTDSGLLTDEFSFGILADYSALENWGKDEYAKKNFRIAFVSQIPLRWR